MSSPPRRRGSTIAIVLFVLSLSAACGAVTNKGNDPFTRVTLVAATADGKPPSGDEMKAAREILAARVADAGFDDPQVVIDGGAQIVISVPGRHNADEFTSLVSPAQLRFRKVLSVVDGGGLAGTPPTASASGTVTQDQVHAKLGQAMTVAQALTAPVIDPSVLAVLAPFATLTPAEVAVLSPEIQFYVPHIACPTLGARPVSSIQDGTQRAVACQGMTKYYLDVAKVAGTDIAGAGPQREPQTDQWVVTLNFNPSGQEKWTNLTREAFNNHGDPKCAQEALGDQGRCLVAIVLDNTVISAPEIQGVLTGNAQISGSFDEKAAKTLASQIKSGGLPIAFVIQGVAIIDPQSASS